MANKISHFKLHSRLFIFDILLERIYISMQVRWEFKRWNGSFQPFTPEENTKLEKAYIDKEEGTEYNISEANGKVVTWKVDFKSMQTTDGNHTKEIQRKPLDEGKKSK